MRAEEEPSAVLVVVTCVKSAFQFCVKSPLRVCNGVGREVRRSAGDMRDA